MATMMIYFHVTKRELLVLINSFTCNLHQKHFNNSSVYKNTLRVITNRVKMKIFKLQRDDVRASWTKMYVKELRNLFYSSNIISVIKL